MKHFGEVVFSSVATLAFALTINVELTLLTFLAVPLLVRGQTVRHFKTVYGRERRFDAVGAGRGG